MITEDYVSFETAKLLKEKGFDGGCTQLYNFEKQIERATWPQSVKHDGVYMDRNGYILCPTIQMVMKWLDDKYGIFISFDKSYKIEDKLSHISTRFTYSYKIKNINTVCSKGEFTTKEQAAEAAIKYCLENKL